MVDGLLTGFRAIDVADDKGFVCAKILAALGVDVIKVEKPGGDVARRIPPFYGNIPAPEKSLYWLAFNTDKRSITLNIETGQGQDLFKKLVKKVDFVIESFSPGYMDNCGLGYAALSLVNPRIIMTSITPFGQKGPYSHYKGCDLVVSAMGGVLDTTGDSDRPPVKEGLDSMYYHGNVVAAFGTVISHYHREITGEGQQVDVSLQEVAASRDTVNLYVWELDKRLRRRIGANSQWGANATRVIWPCKDGYVVWILYGGPMGAPANQAVSQWIDEDGIENPLRMVENWAQFDMNAINQEALDILQAAIGNLFLRHTKKEIADEGLKRGINATVVNNMANVLEYPQLKARNYWVNLEYPELDTTLAYPRHFILCSETDNCIKHRAPRIGEHNDEIYGKELGLSSTEINALKKTNVI